MVDDSRESGRVVSKVLEIASGDNSVVTLVNLDSGFTFVPTSLRVSYHADGGVNANVSLHDDPDGTASGNLTDTIDSFPIAPGDHIILEDFEYRDIEDSLLVYPDGNQDDQVTVTVGGYYTTA